MTAIANEIELHPNWDAPGTSDEFESLLVEAELALLAAPNVIYVYGLTDSHGDSTIGFAVQFADFSKDFFIASDYDQLNFSADGSLLTQEEHSGEWKIQGEV